MYSYSSPDVFHSFFKPLLGELRKKIEVTSMELNIFFSVHLATAEQSAYSLELGMEERIPPNIS